MSALNREHEANMSTTHSKCKYCSCIVLSQFLHAVATEARKAEGVQGGDSDPRREVVEKHMVATSRIEEFNIYIGDKSKSQQQTAPSQAVSRMSHR